jgi:hypothetical protein
MKMDMEEFESERLDMDNTATKPDMVDATDSLEAISVFKSMKNLLFFICFVCLLLLQGVFWLEHCSLIKEKGDVVETEISLVAADIEELAENDEIERFAEIATDEVSAEAPEAAAETAKPKRELAKEILALAIPNTEQAVVIVKVCNFILIVASCAYTLALLMSVKISLAGRLGGISHISRGFFRSMFAFVFVLPWQECFDGVVAGAIYTPDELFGMAEVVKDLNVTELVFYYFRFSGLWVIVVVLLILAQMSTIKWSRVILKRLGYRS